LGPRGREQKETGENHIMRGFVICTFLQMLLGWGIKDEKCICLGHRGIGGKMTPLKFVGRRDVDWIHLAQDRGLLWVLVNTEMDLLFL
jgi:hypothetical protein